MYLKETLTVVTSVPFRVKNESFNEIRRDGVTLLFQFSANPPYKRCDYQIFLKYIKQVLTTSNTTQNKIPLGCQ
jgi:hypothetical protein